jgi:hypothetical protein
VAIDPVAIDPVAIDPVAIDPVESANSDGPPRLLVLPGATIGGALSESEAPSVKGPTHESERARGVELSEEPHSQPFAQRGSLLASSPRLLDEPNLLLLYALETTPAEARLPYGWTRPEAARLHREVVAVSGHGLDLAILVDISRSMRPAFGDIRRELGWVLPALAWGLEGTRAALLLYRDDVEAVEGFEEDSVAAIQGALESVRAEGGGDVPEGVHVVVREALALKSLSWRERAAKNLFLLGDAPPPFDELSRLERLLAQARGQGGYTLHALGFSTDTESTGTPFFDRLAAAGGGRSVTLAGTDVGEELLGCLFLVENNHRLDPNFLRGLRWLFRSV